MAHSTNTFSSLKALLKDKYSDNKKNKKAMSEQEASANPEKFMKKMKNPSIKGLKGIAF